jgi:hypothetical protein
VSKIFFVAEEERTNTTNYFRRKIANLFYWWNYLKSYKIESSKTRQEIIADGSLAALGLGFAFISVRIFRHFFFENNEPRKIQENFITIFLKIWVMEGINKNPPQQGGKIVYTQKINNIFKSHRKLLAACSFNRSDGMWRTCRCFKENSYRNRYKEENLKSHSVLDISKDEFQRLVNNNFSK